jgi:hypothetical protein
MPPLALPAYAWTAERGTSTRGTCPLPGGALVVGRRINGLWSEHGRNATEGEKMLTIQG